MKKSKVNVIKVNKEKSKVSLSDYFENEDKYDILSNGRIVKKSDVKDAQLRYREMLKNKRKKEKSNKLYI